MFSLDMALKVCERIRLRGERGSQVKEGVMFVSASAESNWSGTSSINTPRSHAVRRAFRTLGPTHTVEREEAAILEM